eukprot:GHVH01003115.1.p1 GENE.GHVH01003115.1~~GHVH01003115.1.p1  ORF type:complete len:107 (-),score=28.57 GHVH01003115.1:60-380(-)
MASVKYPASVLLAELAGNVSKDSVTKILKSVGDVDAALVDAVVNVCADSSATELVEAGLPKLASMTGGCAGAGGAGAASAASAAPAEEAKKEESESDDDIGFSLFD